ncbi:MAG: hypothetical protein JKY84_06160 [Emcibacteraceae bacterium]|nr:hypothetical protein [Emcibacteraceae bacterium]
MKFFFLILTMSIFNIKAIAQDNTLSPIQLEKGDICGIVAGINIREILYEGSKVTVERIMGEGDFYLKYNFDVENCAIVSAITDDNGDVFRVSIGPSKYVTAGGAHVGMTLRELKIIYPKAILAFQFDGMGSSGGQYSFSIDKLGVFTIDASSIMKKCGDKFPYCEDYMMGLKTVNFFTY